MVSPHSNTSRAINSLALKYLSYEELGRFEAKHSRQGKNPGGQKTRPAEYSLPSYGLGGGEGQGVAGKDGQD